MTTLDTIRIGTSLIAGVCGRWHCEALRKSYRDDREWDSSARRSMSEGGLI